MVFEPTFFKHLANYETEFKYIVNNANTSKTLNSLSNLFFGIEKYNLKIKSINSLKIDLDETIEDGIELIIPNYI